MPANLPASRAIWLRSQLAPWALIGAERADTSPGRSSPMQVRVKVAMGAGYEIRVGSRCARTAQTQSDAVSRKRVPTTHEA